MSVSTISFNDLKSFVNRTQASVLAFTFMQIVESAINTHKDHNPIIGIVNMLNYKDTEVLIMWTIPFDEYTAMLKVKLVGLEGGDNMFSKKTLQCSIYLGKGNDVIFKDHMGINEENATSKNPIYNWHYRLIENNYDRIEPIAPSFISHILDQAEQVVVVPPEIAEILIKQAQDHAVAPEDFVEEDEF
jgi:hypothetical protein